MQQIDPSELETGAYYWAVRQGVSSEEMELEIVRARQCSDPPLNI
ncbi:hypothetical protein [Rhizobium populisoli]|nr:hypothetical protein [Rhizobium populisoli]